MSKEDDYGEPTSDLNMKDGKADFSANHGCCRDLYCLIIFAAGIVGVIIVFALGFSKGHPQTLIYPINMNGKFCGLNKDGTNLKDFPYLYRPIITNNTIEVCVKECPVTNNTCFINDKDGTGHFDGAIAPEECIPSSLEAFDKLPNLYPMTDLVWRCVPNVKGITQQVMPAEYTAFYDTFTTGVNDLIEGWWVILIAAVLAVIFALLWTLIFQCCGKICIWICIIAAIILIFIAGLWLLIYGFDHYKDALQTEKTNSIVIIVVGVILIVADVIFVLIILFLRSRINLAIDLIIEAGKVLRNTLSLILVPLCYILIFLIVSGLFIVTFIYYCSIVEMKIEGGNRELIFSKSDRLVLLFTFFMFLWVMFFLVATDQATIAGVGASFYFSRTADDRPTFPVALTLKTILLHHLGSLAVGSFIIAVVAFIRAIVLYFQQKAKEAKNSALKCFLSCVQCCLGCLQRILEFLTSNAYIVMMIHGKGFFHSAIDALKLLLRNPLRTFIINKIAGFIIVIGILASSLLSIIVSFIILRPDFIGGKEYSSPVHVFYWWLILFFCFIVAFAVSYMFLNILNYLVDVIFMCFLQDEEMSSSGKGGYRTFASDDLKAHMNRVAEDDEKRKNEKDSKRVEPVIVGE